MYAAPNDLTGIMVSSTSATTSPQASSFLSLGAQYRIEKSFIGTDRLDVAIDFMSVDYEASRQASVRDSSIQLEYDIDLGERLSWMNEFEVKRSE